MMKKNKKLLGCAINEQLSSYGVEILYILKIRSRTPSEWKQAAAWIRGSEYIATPT
jgi:hypothetical protein